MGKLRLVVKGTTLRIEPDKPYSKNYNIQFLNLERSSQNRISVATDVFGSMNTQNKQILDNGSNSEVKVQGNNNFWAEVENNIKVVLGQGESIGKYSIHKQAGLITVYGNKIQHDLIDDYLVQLKHVTGQQVLIEAKIIEVNLKDAYKSGINWQKLGGGDLVSKASFGSLASSAPFIDPAFGARDGVNFGVSGTHFSAILQALEEFGSSRTLSSPRLTVMNNQTAILKVAQNQVYFRLNYDRTTGVQNNLQNTSVSSDIQTVPIGLVMSVQPSIDSETGDILLFLRPTISKLAQTVSDPAIGIAYTANGGTGSFKESVIPVVDVKEIDSILKVKSGEIAILGGLMEVKSNQDQGGLPGLLDVPLVKDLFSSRGEADQVVELVIVLKATIVDKIEPDEADKRLLTNYLTDTRPL